MSLPALNLDDLTYEDLRLLAVRQIPASSGENWTHHAPVDPGITMLELFAFLLDQQLFILDQVPDAMVHAILGLLEESPNATQAARTVLVSEPGSLSDFASTSAREPLRPSDNALHDLVFSTQDAALFPPVRSLSLFAGENNLDSELIQGNPAIAFTGLDSPGSLRIDVQLSHAFRLEHAGAEIALALVLSETGVSPEWDQAAIDVPPPAQFTLEWVSGATSQQFENWTDGTGGLRRSGLIRFAIPDALVGRDRLSLILATENAGHAEPVFLQAAYFGAAVAEHRWHWTIGPSTSGDQEHDAAFAILDSQITNWLPNSGPQLDLPAQFGAPFENDMSIRLLHPRDGWQEWNAASHLDMARSEDRIFTIDRQIGQLQFGNGYQGRIPAPAGKIELSASSGGGKTGNHAAGLQWRRRANDTGDLRLVSAVAATGGADAETLEAARTRVSALLKERHRAVTEEDYRHLVDNAKGIAIHRSHVAEAFDPAFPCVEIPDSVTIFVVPRTSSQVVAPRADDGALSHIRTLLDEARLLTMRVFVERPTYRPVSISLTVAGYDSSDYRALLAPVLAEYLHSTTGGSDGTGWAFGAPLRPSEILRVAQSKLPRGARVEKALLRLDDDENVESDCTDIPIGAHELVYLSGLRIALVEPAHAEAAL